VIDLRSDTVTRPSAAMREAMSRAEVGDDVYGEDPTVNRLQERVSELLGTEAALFVPSGSMANQIGIQVSTRPGDEALVGQGAHVLFYESGAAAAFGGVQLTPVGDGGLFSGADVDATWKVDNHHHGPTALVCVENTHNRGGGRVWPLAQLDEVKRAARAHGLALHLDGARLWNAAVATLKSEKELAAGFDTVSVCLSKGLGAPVGSLVCGSKERIHRAHRLRKMFGGGMRQAGILAAAGLHALDHHRSRLAEDHANAARFAQLLAGTDHARVVGQVETNIVLVDLVGLSASVALERLRERGVLAGAFGPERLRFVTHLDVDRDACERAAEALKGVRA
jgi:threonine aldolase